MMMKALKRSDTVPWFWDRSALQDSEQAARLGLSNNYVRTTRWSTLTRFSTGAPISSAGLDFGENLEDVVHLQPSKLYSTTHREDASLRASNDAFSSIFGWIPLQCRRLPSRSLGEDSLTATDDVAPSPRPAAITLHHPALSKYFVLTISAWTS
ncbi:hypothetical protein BDZ89DRAFT_1141643 [Hymenopellis radicata]|nr:hypothetical protein BDZ89DRAFT_1141643 [Hymenopellis radicata]